MDMGIVWYKYWDRKKEGAKPPMPAKTEHEFYLLDCNEKMHLFGLMQRFCRTFSEPFFDGTADFVLPGKERVADS